MEEILKNTYFTILKEKIKNRKTPIYHICDRSQNEIAQIKWYPNWRKYCFFPCNLSIWDEKCLNEIIKFIKNLK